MHFVIKLSGGEEKAHFEGFKNKQLVQKYLAQIAAKNQHSIEFVNSATKATDYVVIPNHVSEGSPSSLKWGTKTLKLDHFVDLLESAKKKAPSTRKGRKKKSTTKGKKRYAARTESEPQDPSSARANTYSAVLKRLESLQLEFASVVEQVKSWEANQ